MAEWIEITMTLLITEYTSSPLAMAEWIEIRHVYHPYYDFLVSASDGGVD